MQTRTPQGAKTDQPRQFSQQEFIPLDVGLALTKEKLLLEHYFGVSDCTANDFIDAKLDAVLAAQLLDPQTTKAQAQLLVRKYLSNYVTWAYYAQLHSVKSQYKEPFSKIIKEARLLYFLSINFKAFLSYLSII